MKKSEGTHSTTHNHGSHDAIVKHHTDHDNMAEEAKIMKPSIALRDDPYYRIDPDKYNGWFRGYVRQDWGTIDPRQGGEVEELRAGWIELFFDLIYVAGIVHISSEAVYSLEGDSSYSYADTTDDSHYYSTSNTTDPYATTAGHHRLLLAGSSTHDGGDIESNYFDFLWCTFGEFALLVSIWNEHVQIESKFVLDQRMDSSMRFLVMLFILLMGGSIKDAQDHFQIFLLGFIIVRILLIMIYFKISLIPRAKGHGYANMLLNTIIVIICIILEFTIDGGAATWFWTYTCLYLFSYFGGWVAQWSRYYSIAIPVNVPHLTERLGLFTMLILGEAIISLMTADVDDETVNESEFGIFGWVAVWAIAFLITYSIGLLYFDSQPSEHAIIHVPGSHALRSTGMIVFFFCVLV